MDGGKRFLWWKRAVVLVVMTISQLFSSSWAAEKAAVIKIATVAPEGSAWTKAFNAINADVKKNTGDRVQLKIYAGGVLGDERDMLRKMQIGQIHGAALSGGGLSNLFSELDLFQIPFLFQTYEEVDFLIEKMDPFFRKGFEDNGYVLLGWSEGGFVYLMTNAPMASVSEFKKAKVWIWEDSPMAKAIFDEAGISAIPLSVPDVMVGLQTGLVDVVYAPPAGAISLQWFTKVKYILDVPLIYLVGGIVMRKDVFKGLPQPHQEALLEAFRAHVVPLRQVLRKENEEAIRVMERHGVKVIKPAKEHVEEFKALWDKAALRLGRQSFSKKVLDEASSLLQAYRRGNR
jgi:TRAP-type C4-dicarboxylate transport system substrate-binding protein